MEAGGARADPPGAGIAVHLADDLTRSDLDRLEGGVAAGGGAAAQEPGGAGYAEKRLALEALGVHVTVGNASDTPRWVVRMEIDGPRGSEGQPIGGQVPVPGPLVLRWTDADEVEGLAADEARLVTGAPKTRMLMVA